MTYALEKGHESGVTQTVVTVVLTRESATLFGRSEPAEHVCGFLMTEDFGHHQRRLALLAPDGEAGAAAHEQFDHLRLAGPGGLEHRRVSPDVRCLDPAW